MFTDNRFAKCSWAHVVTSFKQSHVSQSGDICPILACVFLWNPCMPSDTITCYQWTCLPAEMFWQVFLSIPQHGLSHLVFTNATKMIKWNIRPIYFVCLCTFFNRAYVKKPMKNKSHSVLQHPSCFGIRVAIKSCISVLCDWLSCHVITEVTRITVLKKAHLAFLDLFALGAVQEKGHFWARKMSQ